ncbi:MAG: NADH-quinone oxidoreductase subunit K [Rhodopseudomonas palustris]|nr:NADH-quinone oxidoreductase subunit K [Rhodopseudomonas palustris]
MDVAMTEAAIGSGLTGLLLLGVATRLPRSARQTSPTAGRWTRLLAGILSVTVAGGLAAVVLLLPDPAPTLAPAVADRLPTTGLGNPVTGVLIAFRAIDTLLESVVLVFAIIGVWSLAPKDGWGERPGWLRPAPLGSALTLLAQLLPPIGILVGIHLFWTGANAPGGAFQGGAVLAAMWVLTMIAGLDPPARGRSSPAASGAGDRAGALSGCRGGGDLACRSISGLPGRLCQATDPRHRSGAHPVHRGGTGSPAGRPTRSPVRSGAAAMTAVTLFGLCGAALVGLGLYGLIVLPGALRRIVAFNLLGSGVFLLFGVIARRGGGVIGETGSDPVPQALIITGLVVAFAATALAVALLRRLLQETGRDDWDEDGEAGR